MPASSGFDRARLSPEDRKRLVELIARFKEKWRESGLDRTMTTRELLTRYPGIAAGDIAPHSLADGKLVVDEASGDGTVR
jgi:hypothetical protein